MIGVGPRSWSDPYTYAYMGERTRPQLPWKKRQRKSDSHDFVMGLATRALAIVEPAERTRFMEQEIRRAFGFRKAEILVRPERSERFSTESMRIRDVLARIGGILKGTGKPFLNQAVGRELGLTAILGSVGGTYAFPVGKVSAWSGILVIDSSPVAQLDSSTEKLLVSLCGQIAVVLDNSDLLRAKLELEHTLARQAQLVQIGEMAARIAHEIKNPLSSIKTIVQVMQEDPSLEGTYGKDLELIRGEVDRLADSVGQLLDFAHPAREQARHTSLGQVVASVSAFLRRDIERNQITVVIDMPESLPDVSGSPSIFREIFLNLLLNAIQAGQPGMCLKLAAREGMVENERFVVATVEDDGPGIPVEVQSKVFLPFFTTRQRGTGLGLAIVKRNVEHLGGQITLESPAHAGRGARFVFHVPVA